MNKTTKIIIIVIPSIVLFILNHLLVDWFVSGVSIVPMNLLGHFLIACIALALTVAEMIGIYLLFIKSD
jgi:hypothetical protein